MIDSHCHLAGEEFETDLAHVIDRARQAGVRRAIVILAAQDDAEIGRWSRVRELWPECRAAVGVHPHQAGLFGQDPAGAARLLESRLDSIPGLCAVGEIGLDYHYDFAPRHVQQAVFRARVLTIAKDALERYRLDLAATRFDLEATRREREALRAGSRA